MKKAKKYLEQYAKIDPMIVNKFYEAERWDALATSITAQMSGERVQSSGNQQKMEDAILKSVDIRQEIKGLIAKKKEIISTIESLPLAEYEILHKAYIQGKDFKTIAYETGNSYSWVTTVHGRGIKQVQRILDERKG